MKVQGCSVNDDDDDDDDDDNTARLVDCCSWLYVWFEFLGAKTCEGSFPRGFLDRGTPKPCTGSTLSCIALPKPYMNPVNPAFCRAPYYDSVTLNPKP